MTNTRTTKTNHYFRTLIVLVAMIAVGLTASAAPAFALSQGATFKSNCTAPSVYYDQGTKKWRDDYCGTLIRTYETTNSAGYVGTWNTWSTKYADGSPETTNSYLADCKTPTGDPSEFMSDCL
jgi:hypothetical protein